MTLLPDQRQALDAIISDAYDTAGPVLRDVTLTVIDELRRLEGGGIGWVGQVLDDWLVSGAQTEVRQWMRRQPVIVGKTKRGTVTEVPAFGGVRVEDEGGHVQHVQLRLLSMTADELEAHIRPKRKQRDTLSRGLSFYESVLVDMRDHRHPVVAEAIECMGLGEGREVVAS